MCCGCVEEILSITDEVADQRGLLANEHLFEMSSARRQGKLRIFRPLVFYVEKTDKKRLAQYSSIYNIFKYAL